MPDDDDGTYPFGSNMPGGRCTDPDCPCNKPLEPFYFLAGEYAFSAPIDLRPAPAA